MSDGSNHSEYLLIHHTKVTTNTKERENPFVHFVTLVRHRKFARDLKLSASRCARERNHVTNIRDTRHEHQHPFKAQSETRMRNSPVTPEIEIPFVIGRIHFVAEHNTLTHLTQLLP